MTETADPLRALLTQVGWQPEELADKLDQFAGRHGYAARIHPKTPYKWLAGKKPRAPWVTLTCALLSERLQRIIEASDLGWPDDGTTLLPATAGLALPWTGPGSLQACKVVMEGGFMQRRTMFLTVLGSGMSESALEWLIAHPAGDVSRRAGHPLPMEVVDCLDAMTGSLRRMDDQLGGAHTFELVRTQLHAAIDMIEMRRYTDKVGRRLHGTVGEMLRLAGWLAFDAGRHAQAQRLWNAALRAAHAAGDHALGANILGFQSCLAKDLGEIRVAVTLAETARAGYKNQSPQVSAILNLRVAEAYANAQDADRTKNAIEAAFNTLNTTPDSSGNPPWSYWLTPSHADAQAGYCYMRLGDWSRARVHLMRSSKQHHQESAREGALRDVLLATTYARQERPDLGRACGLGTQAIATLSGQVDSPRCVKHVQNLIGYLRPYHRTPVVRDFRTAAGDLLRTAPST
jgi:hypothetical protein